MANPGYNYKGISLSEIYTNTGVSTTASTPPYNSYVGIPVSTNTPYTYLRPNPFGYLIGNIQLSDSATAKSSLYTSPTANVKAPVGCKHMTVIAVGGGGGGGGGGGKANANSYSPNKFASAWGGPGGLGGLGGYGSAYRVVVPSDANITITIGTAGTGGMTSNDDHVESSNYNYSNTNGNTNDGPANSGTSGTPGTATSIVLNGTTPIVTASGGGGGGGGVGAWARASSSNANANNGATGTAGTPAISQYITNTDYPQFDNNGNPGIGGTDGEEGVNMHNNGSPGQSGAVQIIWLYD